MKYYIQDNIDETKMPVVFDNHSDALDYIFDNDLTMTHEIIADSTKTYYFCDEDNYGQRTGTYQSIELSHDDIMLDRHGNIYHNGHFLYKSEEQIIIACSK
jgi:hypothetical protein